METFINKNKMKKYEIGREVPITSPEMRPNVANVKAYRNSVMNNSFIKETGGSTETCGPGPGCNHSKAARKNKRQKTWRNVKEGAGKVVGAVLTAGALGAGAYYGSKLLKEQRNGGPVKRKK